MRAVGLPLLCAAAGALAAAGAAGLRALRRRRRLGRLKRALQAAVRDMASHPAWDPARACILLSGGLDSAWVAEVGGRALGLKAAFTVICSEDATDLPYATASAAAAGLEHVVVRLPPRALLAGHLATAVRVLRSFDPMTLRNEVAITAALSEAAARGFTCCATGDGADELLGGYGFTHGLAPAAWAAHRGHMARVMAFGSVPLGAHVGVHVASPFTAPGVVAAALALGKGECVKGEGRAAVGKVPLRELFPGVSAARRRKDPIEVGCGTTALSRPGHWDDEVSDGAFAAGVAAAAAQGVAIRDKEHLVYYTAFRDVFPGGHVPEKPRNGSDPCPKCGYKMSERFQTFCTTCGHYDPELRKRHD